MPISLDARQRRLISRLSTLDSVFDRHAIAGLKRRTERSALQEGLVSALWQCWCAFCRDVLLGSALGTSTRAGIPVTSPLASNSEPEICYVARELSFRRSVTRIRPLAGSHLEPTWGDLGKLNLILSGIAFSNQAQLLSAFGAALALIDLQICRNASAHINSDTLATIRSARVRYQDTQFAHPSDVIFWVDPRTRDYVWKTWVDEITIVSNLAVA
jgi:hypothetical protein